MTENDWSRNGYPRGMPAYLACFSNSSWTETGQAGPTELRGLSLGFGEEEIAEGCEKKPQTIGESPDQRSSDSKGFLFNQLKKWSVIPGK